MEPTEMIEFLKRGSLRVVLDTQHVCKITHTCNDQKIYFWCGGSYDSYNNHDINDPSYRKLLTELTRIKRIEKEMNFIYYPIWTIEDGEITQTENFVKLNGRYYTIQFLEQLLDKITEFKKINI